MHINAFIYIYECVCVRMLGIALLECIGSCLGFECCEELWSPSPPHSVCYLLGAEIVSNGSSSYFEKNKHHRRLSLLREATQRHCGVYAYANQGGADGGRVVFDGGSAVYACGAPVAVGPRCSLLEVSV